MCQFCNSEGCDHDVGRWHNSPCRCSLAGPSKCEECGCDCSPWYDGLEIPGKQDLTYSLIDYREEDGFPASKAALVAYIKQDRPEDSAWLSDHLPEGTYKDPGDVMTALTPSLESLAGGTMLAPTQVRSVAAGTRLVVRDGEAAAMLHSGDNSPCDVLLVGTSTLSPASCPILASKSRGAAPGFDRIVLQGYPVFVSLKKELQVPILLVSQNSSRKPIGVKGMVRLSVQAPETFASFGVSNKSGHDDASLQGYLSNRFSQVLRSTLFVSQPEEIKANTEVLAGPLTSAAAEIGLKANVVIEYAGVPTQEMSLGMMNQMMGTMASNMAVAQEAMRAAMLRQQTQGRGGSVPGAPPSAPAAPQGPSQQAGTRCPKCNSANPPGVKFCNNCGAPLGMRKCTQCGTENNPGVNFCGNCGSKV